MYQIISTVGKSATPGSGWMEVDVVGKSFSILLNDYTEIYVTVTHPFLEGKRLMRLTELQPKVTNLSQTLTEFLNEHASEVLPNQAGDVKIVTGEITFADAYYAGYKIDRTKYSRSPDQIPDVGDADALVMSKDGVSPTVFQKNCLVAVNNLLYRSSVDKKNIYVPDCGSNFNHCYRNEVGVLNFSSLGGIETIDINPEMVSRMNPKQPMNNQVVITVDNYDFTGKSVALVFAGRLFISNAMVFAPMSDKSFVFDTQNIDLADIYLSFRRVVDSDFLGMELNGSDSAQFNRAQLYSDEVIKKLLTHPLSYLVAIKSDNLEVTYTQLRETTSARDYISYTDLKTPAFYENGEIAIYWKQYDDGFWNISVNDNFRDDYLYHRAPANLSPMPADNQRPYAPRRFKRLFATGIRSQNLKITGG